MNTFLVLLLALMASISQSVVFTLEQGLTRCLYSDLDSQKMLQVSFQIRKDQPSCLLVLTVSEQPELHDRREDYPVQRYHSSFQCQDAPAVFEPFVQKFSVNRDQGMARLKVCVGAARTDEMVWVTLNMNEKINPYYLEQTEELSYVTSGDLRILHETIHNLSNKLMGLEALQGDFKQTEEQLMQTNEDLKQSLKNVSRFQLLVIVAIGVLWVVILRTAKNIQ